MTHGRIWTCDRWQLRVQAAVSLGGVPTPADGAGGTAATRWAPSQTSVLDGFVLTAGRKGAQQRYVRLQIPALNVDTGPLYGGAGNGTIEALLEIDGLTVHLGGGDPPLWRLSWSAMRLYRDGTQAWSAGAGSYSDPQTCARVAPSGVPLIGIPATLSASCQALMPSAPACSIPVGDLSVYPDAGPHSATVVGGWRFREAPASAWVELPVDCTVVSPPAPAGCACPVPTLAIPTASTTWNAQCSAAIGGTGGTAFSGYRRECSVTLVPSLPRSFALMTGTDYAALWVRGGFPRCAAVGTSTGHDCSGFQQPVSDCSASEETERLAARPQALATVVWVDDPANPGQRLPHPIEEPLTQPVKAPYRLEALSYTTGPWPSDCSVLREGSYPVVSQTGAVLPILRPTDPVACYVDTWANPHWSYLYWFPPPPQDPESPLQPWEWPVDGARVPSDAYWVPLRTQWLNHPSLPEEERRRTRTSLLSAPLWENGLRQELNRSYVAAPTTSWVGVCRFEAWAPSPPGSVALDQSSSPAWSGANCALAFGPTTVTVSGSNAGLRTVEIDLGRWTERPWMHPAFCRAVGLYWVPSQVQSVAVKAIGADGSEVLLHSGQNPPGSALAWPQWDQSQYAGSWAQSYGLGVVADSPSDSQPDGASSAHMASPELSTGWRLGSARSPAVLRLEILPASNGPVALQYPVFYRPTTAAAVVAENGHQQAALWPSAASWRFGQLRWLDPSTNQPRQTPAAVSGPGSAYAGAGYRASALDALCEVRARLEGRDRTDQLQAQIQSLWDATERSGRPTDVRAADELTLSWLHPYGSSPIVCLANSWREVPPLAVLPRRARDAALAETGGWTLTAHDWAWEPRVLAVPAGFHPALKPSPSGGDVLAPRASPAGWDVRHHRLAVDNAEAGWGVWFGGRSVAAVRPWHGWSAAPREPAPQASPVYAVSDSLVHLLLANDGSAVRRSVTPNAALPLLDPTLPTGLPTPAGGWSLAWRGRVAALAVSDGAAVAVWTSTDLGGSWTMTALGTGRNPAVVCRRDGGVDVYYVRSGSLYVRRSRDGLATWAAEQACGVTGLDDAPIDAGESVGPGGERRTVLVATASGQLRQWVSADGVAFS